jgi:hypothetical protein
VVILGTGLGSGVTAVHLAVSSKVGDHREMTATALNLAGKSYSGRVSYLQSSICVVRALRTLLAGMTIHVRLQGAGTSEALVADLALVLLLGT